MSALWRLSMLNGQKRLYDFGQFRLDSGERVLLRNGEGIPLPPKVFDTLLLLVQNSGRALDKGEMMGHLWPDTFVEEVNLAQHISVLRKVLGENRGEPQYIETLPKRGYRFIADVREVSDPFPPAVPESQAPKNVGHRVRVLTFLSVAGLSIFAVGFAVSRFLTPSGPRPLKFTPLVVDSTLKLFPAWSPNGRTVAYAGETKGTLQIFTRTLGASTSTQITHQSNDCFRPFWAPNGERIYYLAYPGSEAVSYELRRHDLWSVGAAGGVPELVRENVSAAAISPDGRTLAMLRTGQGTYPGELWLASPPDAEPTKYTENPFATLRYPSPWGELHFSPDGSKLAVSVFSFKARPSSGLCRCPRVNPIGCSQARQCRAEEATNLAGCLMDNDLYSRTRYSTPGTNTCFSVT